MRTKHILKILAMMKCPKEGCGFEYEKKINLEYTTNQKGDIIEHRVLSWS